MSSGSSSSVVRALVYEVQLSMDDLDHWALTHPGERGVAVIGLSGVRRITFWDRLMWWLFGTALDDYLRFYLYREIDGRFVTKYASGYKPNMTLVNEIVQGLARVREEERNAIDA